MRVSAPLFPLLVAGVATACNETPTRPAAATTLTTPSLSAAAQGSPPPLLYFKTRGAICLEFGAIGEDVMTQTVTLLHASNLLVLFTYEWARLDLDQEGLLHFTLDGQAPAPFEWGFAGSSISRTSGTVTWSFTDVPAGTHTVAARARVEGGDLSAGLNECAMTVFVFPSVARGE